MSRIKTEAEALEEFTVYLKNNPFNRRFLEERDFQERNGDGSPHPQEFFAVQPFKKWFWKQTGYSGMLLEVKDETFTTYKLKMGSYIQP